MDEKVELNEFLNQLTAIIKKRLDSYETTLKSIKGDLERIKISQDQVVIRNLENKIKNLEFSLSSLKNRNQIDKSILKNLESGEDERRI
jgi:hypothetical protein